MHGIVHVELMRYVETVYGEDVWETLLEKAGLGSKLYMASQAYDDQEIYRLMETASEMTGKRPDELLRAFGEFVLPNLMNIYKTLIDPSWKTIDFLLNVEDTIHAVVRARRTGAEPPQLKVERVASDEVLITYTSHRKLCPFLIGMATGVANYFNEKIIIQEHTCMHKGAKQCQVSIKQG